MVRKAPDQAFAYLTGLLAEARDRSGRADRRAAALAMTALTGGLTAARLTPRDLPAEVSWLWWAGLFLCAMAIVTLAAALWPYSARRAARAVERRRFYSARVSAPRPPAGGAFPAGAFRTGPRAAGPADDSKAGAFSESALAELRARTAGRDAGRDGARDATVRADRLVRRAGRLGAVADVKQRYVRRGLVLLLLAASCCLVSAVAGELMTSWDLSGRPMAPPPVRQAPELPPWRCDPVEDCGRPL
ncbi:hypothetical protein [Streptosporangium pseudovulgare]|uniref:Pycsar effector protein domain-containing protein n=1 Tax=Streptosporangium pseudovulgare TaxID=35765 RepID=A0ABQ2RHT2_9ACTN|nr:hypothetical protein [Streptosporangium pseudovulgare]GGQ32947.1 hypothetical protein GCM10010140_73770 [Streptosporangium pseudovulgare]